MTNTQGFWDAFSPYMDFLENVLGINLDNLAPIIPLIKSPVLVVGAGQGLLVEELQQRGFDTEGIDLSPQMVEYAEKRRGIRLILANANNMPFENGRFKTSIIATGVIDFLNDPDQIAAILNEVRRVTDAQGEVFVALFGVTPQLEELVRYIGFLSDNRLHPKEALPIFTGSENPVKHIITLIRNDPNKSIPGLFFRWIRAFISTPRRIITRVKGMWTLRKRMHKGEIPGFENFRDNLPDSLFLRTSEQIRELFTGLNFPAKNVYEFDNCKIARL